MDFPEQPSGNQQDFEQEETEITEFFLCSLRLLLFNFDFLAALQDLDFHGYISVRKMES
jgi:hypothetical protein